MHTTGHAMPLLMLKAEIYMWQRKYPSTRIHATGANDLQTAKTAYPES